MLGCPYHWGGGENMREAAAAAAATRPPPVWRGFHPSIQSTPPHQRRDESGVGPAAAEAEDRARRGGHAVARSHASHSCSPARAYLLLPLLLRSARGMRESSRRRLYMLLLCSNCIVNQCNMQTSSILLAGIIRSVYKMDYYL